MIFWLLLPMGLMVCVSIVVALFLLGRLIFHGRSGQKACIDDDVITIAKRDTFGDSSENVASLVRSSKEAVKREPVPVLSSLASPGSLWLPSNVQSESARPSSRAVLCPSVSSRSPYASSFNQQQEDSVAEEYRSLIAYRRGVQMYYDVRIEAFFLVFTDFAVENMQCVKSYYQMIYEDTEVLLKERGMEKSGILVDVSGLRVAGKVTPMWGNEVNRHIGAFCRRFTNGDYHCATYFSSPIKDDQEYIKRKKLEIQIKTDAVQHGSQCNLFATKEEAIAYYRYLSYHHH